jgi:hypothetical protein
MLTGATPVANGKLPKDPFGDLKDMAINPHHFIAGGQGALCQDSRGNPWTGDNVFSSAQGLRDVRSPGGAGADGVPARARGGPPGRVRAGDRAADGRRPQEDVPDAADPDRQDPGVQAAHGQGPAPQALSLLSERLQGDRRGVHGPAPGDGRATGGRRRAARGRAAQRPARPAGGVRARLRAEEIRAIADKLRKKAGLPDEPPGEVAKPANGKSTVKNAARKAKSKVT